MLGLLGLGVSILWDYRGWDMVVKDGAVVPADYESVCKEVDELVTKYNTTYGDRCPPLFDLAAADTAWTNSHIWPNEFYLYECANGYKQADYYGGDYNRSQHYTDSLSVTLQSPGDCEGKPSECLKYSGNLGDIHFMKNAYSDDNNYGAFLKGVCRISEYPYNSGESLGQPWPASRFAVYEACGKSEDDGEWPRQTATADRTTPYVAGPFGEGLKGEKKCKAGPYYQQAKWDFEGGTRTFEVRTGITDFWGTYSARVNYENGKYVYKLKQSGANKLSIGAGIGIGVAVAAVMVVIGVLILWLACFK